MLSIGIVGLPNVGKSTLFNALTRKSVPAENYPFCTIDPSVGIVPVSDERIQILADLSQSKKIVPAVIEFIDIAGLVKGASSGEGLGNKFLANIRETDAILQVVRIFEDSNIIHVDGKINPLSDIRTINYELILADLQTIEKRKASLSAPIKKGEKGANEENNLLIKIQEHLQTGKLANEYQFEIGEKDQIKSLHLMTTKEIIYCLNKKSGVANLDDLNDERYKELMSFFSESSSMFVIVDVGLEGDLADADTTEKTFFREGQNIEGLDRLIIMCYELLNLITFFTTGDDETRGWTVPKDSTAKDAGAAIHSDFRDKFIRAEVVYWKDLMDNSGYAGARSLGLVRTEGRDYTVKDGDVIEFKI